MSERDMSQASEELEKESLESTEGKAEARGLEEATHEPGSRVEQIGSVEQAETIESTVKGLVDSAQSTDKLVGDQKGAADISEGLIEKELPEGGQKQKGLREQEDLDGVLEGDFGSLIPGQGELTDPYGKEKSDSGLGGKLGVDVGFGGKHGIDSSSEDPEGDPFGPGGGPGHHVVMDGGDDIKQDELDVEEMISRGASESELAAKEKDLQERALDKHEALVGATAKPQEKDKEDPPPPPPKTSSTSSTPEDGVGTDISPVTAEEFERVLEKTSGDEISMKDPDSPGGDVTDEGINPKYAEKLEAVLETKREISRHKDKKAGAEVVTDPDQEQPEEDVKGKKEAK
jgi:hypothetical protein